MKLSQIAEMWSKYGPGLYLNEKYPGLKNILK